MKNATSRLNDAETSLEMLSDLIEEMQDALDTARNDVADEVDAGIIAPEAEDETTLEILDLSPELLAVTNLVASLRRNLNSPV